MSVFYDVSVPTVDAALVADAQAGDQAAVNALISLVRPMIFRYCRGRLASYAGGVDSADDVAQEVCMAIYHALPGYQDRGAPFSALVFAIAAHKVADARRAFGRRPIQMEDIPERAEPSLTPEQQALAEANFRLAAGLIDRLPARMRDVLILRASGLNAEDTAATLGMTAGAVRVAQHRAVARLRILATESGVAKDLEIAG